MRILHFKLKYEIKLPDKTVIILDPVERMIQLLKDRTFRFKENPSEKYQIRQGSRYKKNTINKHYLIEIYKVEKKNPLEMTVTEILKDMGFNEAEWKLIRNFYPDDKIAKFFLEGIIKINKLNKEKAEKYRKNPTGFIHHFNILEYDYKEYFCSDCQKRFQIKKTEIHKRTDICESCIDKLVEIAMQTTLTDFSKKPSPSLEERDLLKGY